VYSFCVIEFESAVPGARALPFALPNRSCARRFSVIDGSEGAPEPAVYIPGRSTASRFVSLVSRLGPASLPRVRIEVDPPDKAERRVDVRAAQWVGVCVGTSLERGDLAAGARAGAGA